jgi:hypothetical protein
MTPMLNQLSVTREGSIDSGGNAKVVVRYLSNGKTAGLSITLSGFAVENKVSAGF